MSDPAEPRDSGASAPASPPGDAPRESTPPSPTFSTRAERLARAQTFLEKRDFRPLGELLRRLYAEQVPPRGARSRDDPVVRLFRRYSAVFVSFSLCIPLWACFAVPGFARWGTGLAAWGWLAGSLLVAYYLAAMAGYSFWRPGHGAYIALYLALTAANATYAWRHPAPSTLLFVVAHLGGAFSILVILRTAAQNLVRSAPGAKLAFLATATLAVWALQRTYGPSPWALPLAATGALLTGPIWSRLFPESA